jgi:hypothetical protein
MTLSCVISVKPLTLGLQLGFVGIIVEALQHASQDLLLLCQAAQLVDALEACMSDGEHPQLPLCLLVE